MTQRYQPPAEYLKALIADDSPLLRGPSAEANLRRLIEMTRDENPANRDWAKLLLAQQDLDTPDVRNALLAAADDDDFVRAEAIFGLAQRELSREQAALPLFEAAALVAHPSLAKHLRAFAEPSGNDHLDERALEALRAREAAG